MLTVSGSRGGRWGSVGRRGGRSSPAVSARSAARARAAHVEALERRELLSVAPITFDPRATLVPADTSPRAVAVADFDGDGTNDVIAAGATTGLVSVFKLRPDG